MRLHRFYIEEKIEGEGDITLTNPELIHQLSKVFRFHAGDKVILFDRTGFEYEAEINLISKKEISFKIIKKFEKNNVEQKSVSLYLALIKKGNFELAAEKCTEIGVSEIHPIISERSEKKDLNMERLNKIVIEASEQSGRLTLPQVFEVMDLEDAVSQVIKEGKVGVVFHTDVSGLSTSPKITSPNSLHLTRTNRSENFSNNFGAEVCLFVGPEGGWTEPEMELFKKNNFEIKSLGQNILRAETAAMVAVWEVLQ